MFLKLLADTIRITSFSMLVSNETITAVSSQFKHFSAKKFSALACADRIFFLSKRLDENASIGSCYDSRWTHEKEKVS